MNKTTSIWRTFVHYPAKRSFTTHNQQSPWVCKQCLRSQRQRPSMLIRQQRRSQTQRADSPEFESIVDRPVPLIRAGKKHNRLGLMVLATIPVTAFILGCWQIQRLAWKTDLVAKFEDRLVRDPLPLPPQIDPNAIQEFDYRRVYARGKFRHDQEMLIGPRMHDGENGYLVVTPLDRTDEFSGFKGNSTILVNRGWISKSKENPKSRPEGRPQGEVIVEGLLREPWKKNMFTPENHPEQNQWLFPDVQQMAEYTGSQVVWVEETMRPDLLVSYQRAEKGIPIGRAPEVNLRNNHTQYIFTWFSLSLATSIMFWMVVKKPARGLHGRIGPSKQW